MSCSEEKWDRRWLEKSPRPLLPDPWLLRAMPFLSPGTVLDIACGRGRNALYLAGRGFAVSGVDISGQGLKLLAREAQKRNLALALWQDDLEQQPSLPAGPFDAIIQFFYLQRSLLPSLKGLLKPGGTFILRTFSTVGRREDGPEAPDIVLNPGELLEIFSGWETLLHEEGVEQSANGGGLAGIVARKPPALR